MKKNREHIYFTAFFAGIIFLVFFDILILKRAFLKGDYLQQLFPWSSVYSAVLKNFELPLWIREVQCGFPLFAEGQTGVLYPLNLIFFFILPFKAAYNYSFLFHFMLGGIFTYFFARSKGADAWGGALSAVLVSFGSGYAGCFIHVAALKALAWFPLVLLLYGRFIENGRKGPYIALIGLVAGMQLLSGSMQMAVYSLLFYAVYFFLENSRVGYSARLFLRDITAVFLISFLIALPQIIATAGLAAFSNRAELMSLDFALWNSMSPLAFIGLVLPYIGKIFSQGNLIFVGVTGFYFALISIANIGKDRKMTPLVFVLILAVLLALGKYDPLYVMFLKLVKFYSFRAPSRAIYFGIFALSVFAGAGFTYFFKHERKVPSIVQKVFFGVVLAAAGSFFAAKAAYAYFGPRLLEMAKSYVESNIYGKPFHRYDLETYIAKTEAFYASIGKTLSCGNVYTMVSVILLIAAGAFIYVLLRRKKMTFFMKIACLGFISLELFFYSFFGKGMRHEIMPFSYIVPRETGMLDLLQKGGGFFRICPFGDFHRTPLWARPSMNAFYGLDSASLYSPLVNREYFLAMQGLGTVDDSVGIIPASKEALSGKADLLRSLNVKYLVSTEEIQQGAFRFLMKEGDVYLYEIKDHLSRFRFSSDKAVEKPARADINITRYGSGIAKLNVRNAEDGFLVFAEQYYPGWKAYVDGRETGIVKFPGLIQAVGLPPGEHSVVFKYSPLYFPVLLVISTLTFFVVLVSSLLRIIKGRD